jgi:hypothetical protein
MRLLRNDEAGKAGHGRNAGTVRKAAIVKAAPRYPDGNRKLNQTHQNGTKFRINFLSPGLHNGNYLTSIPARNLLLFSMGNTTYLIHWQTGFSGATIERTDLK